MHRFRHIRRGLYFGATIENHGLTYHRYTVRYIQTAKVYGMKKRDKGKFMRSKRDFYQTPPDAVLPLIEILGSPCTYVEPCAGNGALIDALADHGCDCEIAFDIEPQRHDIFKLDAREVNLSGGTKIITNPPWSRPILHELINIFSRQCETWLLFDADWMHTKQAAAYLKYCHAIITVGRCKWIHGSKHVRFDNAAWYLFDQQAEYNGTLFFGKDTE